MLRIKESDSGEGAAKYYDAALVKSDYYAKDPGLWGGKDPELLGLGDTVDREDFIALALNKVPGKEQTLTVRTKEDRRPGYDFCFSVPKSISIYLAETGDQFVEKLAKEAFAETMADIEARMETRVRIGGPDRDRITGNMVYAWFVHREARPVDGMPDPHFHIHAYVFNATFDCEENRWKAGQFGNLKADAPFHEAAFHARLASKLLASGYPIRRTERDFELASVSRTLVEKFSKRTKQIEELASREYTALAAKARAVVKKTGMDFADAFAQVKAELGAKSRSAKKEAKLNTREQLLNWRSQMTPEERASLQTANVKGARSQHLLDPVLAKALAVTHLFERSSVVRELHAAGMFLRRGIGRVSIDQAKSFAAQDARFVRPYAGARVMTTREVLHEEAEMLKIVEAGRDRYEEIGRGGAWEPAGQISDEQKAAVDHIVRSRDLVIAVRGVAGTGKTTMLREAVRVMAAMCGKDVLLFAPSSAAAQVLKDEGFTASETVQQLMANTMLQDLTRGKILVVDEAGFLSAKQMRWLAKFTADNQCRLVLCGDSRQHHAVERGDSLRVLEKTSIVRPAALTKIFRQRIPALRDAIQELSRGETEKGFDKLDEFGVIQEIEEEAGRLAAIAEKHIQAVKEKKRSLIVAPTHGECRQIARAVRQALKSEGLLSEAEQTFCRLEKLNLTASQRHDAINYEPGNVVEFHRRAAGGFKSGEQWHVVERAGTSDLIVENASRRKALSLSQADKFSVFKVESIALSVGDQVRITKNFQSQGSKFRNNELHTVTGLGGGRLSLEKGEIIMRGGLHIDQGLAITSHAAQGKTVDQVIVSVPIESFSQANEAQFYVSMSRAREDMHLFTDSKAALKEAVTKPSSRVSPLGLILDQTNAARGQGASAYLRSRAAGQEAQRTEERSMDR